MIYKDLATLLINLNLGENNIPKNSSKGTLITDILGELRNHEVNSLGNIYSITYNHEYLLIKGYEDLELKKYKYDEIPEFNNKEELIDFITDILRNIAYKES